MIAFSRRAKRGRHSESPRAQSKEISYIPRSTRPESRPFLPDRDRPAPTREDVIYFIRATKRRPDIRLDVLRVLRTNGANGAETPLAGVGIIFTALAIVVAVGAPGENGGLLSLLWVAVGGVLVWAALRFVRVAFAAHTRQVVCTVWLAAYEDALTTERTRGRRW